MIAALYVQHGGALKRLRDAACNGDVSSADLDAADEALAKAKAVT